jgi:hypothetical protein
MQTCQKKKKIYTILINKIIGISLKKGEHFKYPFQWKGIESIQYIYIPRQTSEVFFSPRALMSTILLSQRQTMYANPDQVFVCLGV